MANRPKNLFSILDSGSDEPVGQRREEASLSSRHSRHTELQQPTDNFDPGRAGATCATICRDLLLDFAPALILVKPGVRRRVQALAAYARTLFDFTKDLSLEGERLAQVNRWQFALDQSLDVEPIGQPIFVQMALLEKEYSWNREALDRLTALARARVFVVGDSGAAREQERIEVARALLRALFGDEPSQELVLLAAALFRAHSLLGPRDHLAFRRPDLDLEASEPGDARLIAECADIRGALTRGTELANAPSGTSSALRFACAAAFQIVDQVSARPQVAPKIGLVSRLWLLLQSRFIPRPRTPSRRP